MCYLDVEVSELGDAEVIQVVAGRKAFTLTAEYNVLDGGISVRLSNRFNHFQVHVQRERVGAIGTVEYNLKGGAVFASEDVMGGLRQEHSL